MNLETFKEDRLRTPSRGKGYTSSTYTLRRGLLETKEGRAAYEIRLEQSYNLMRNVQTYAAAAADKLRIEAYHMTNGKTKGQNTWDMLVDQYYFSLIKNDTRWDAAIVTYATFEKEVDDYIRSHYGATSLSALYSNLEGLLSQSEQELAKNTNVGVLVASGNTRAMENFAEKKKELEGDRSMLAKMITRQIIAAILSTTPAYEIIYGKPIAYAPPFKISQKTKDEVSQMQKDYFAKYPEYDSQIEDETLKNLLSKI